MHVVGAVCIAAVALGLWAIALVTELKAARKEVRELRETNLALIELLGEFYQPVTPVTPVAAAVVVQKRKWWWGGASGMARLRF
jgi:hypothetical protein